LPEEAVFDFRIDLVKPLLCALRSIPMPLDFSFKISDALLGRA
jgi:hypothetical protein